MSASAPGASITETGGYTTKGAPLPDPLPIGWGEGEDGDARDCSLSRALLKIGRVVVVPGPRWIHTFTSLAYDENQRYFAYLFSGYAWP